MSRKDFIKSNLVTLVFVAFIFVIGALYIILPQKEYSELEKRYMAQMPNFSFGDLVDGDYTKDFESFMADQTPARSFFIGLDSYYNLSIGNNGSNDVYRGSNGYLIEKPVAENNLLESNVSKIVSFADTIDVPVSLCVVPSKGYVCNDELPKNHLQYRDAQYFKTIENLSGDRVGFINIMGDMNTAKEHEQLYYKTDHHWTSKAAYIAYNRICNALDLKPTKEAQFSIDKMHGFYGTSYSNSGYWFNDEDTVEIWRNLAHDDNITVSITEGSNTEHHNSLFFDENAKKADKYTTFLDGNHSYVTIENSDVADGTLLVVKDSFAHCLVPFLADNYNKIIMVDLRYYLRPISEVISAEKADRVLFLYGIDNLAESTDIILN